MKRILLFTALVAALAGCKKEESPIDLIDDRVWGHTFVDRQDTITFLKGEIQFTPSHVFIVKKKITLNGDESVKTVEYAGEGYTVYVSLYSLYKENEIGVIAGQNGGNVILDGVFTKIE